MVLDADDPGPVVFRQQHIVTRRVEVGLLVPLRPRYQVAPSLGAQGLAGVEDILVNVLGIEQICQPVMLCRVEIGQKEVLPLEA